jgi:chemotaxis protein histidine kinase CheA
LVIDISEAVLGKDIPSQVAGAGGISAVKTATYGTDAAAIARIIITFKDEYETDIAVVDDTRLTVKIFGGPVRPESPKPAPPPEVAEVAPAPTPAPTPAPETKAAPAPTAKAPPVEEEAESFSEDEGQDAEGFEEEEAAPAPKAPPADEPQRAEEALAEKKRMEEEQLAEKMRLAEEESQRKAQEAQTAREAKEAQRSDAEAAREAEKASKEEARAEKERLKDEARERKRQEAEEKARLAAEEKQRRKEALLTEQELRRATAPLSTGVENEKTRILEFVGFKVEGGISRLFVRTNEPVRFSFREQGDKVMVLELENTRMGNSRLKLPLDTSFFDSPVLRIAPQQAKGPTLIAEIQLREAARFRTQQDGNEVYVEFERR